eukprot:g12896.t1
MECRSLPEGTQKQHTRSPETVRSQDRFVFREAGEGNSTRWVLESQSGQAKVFGTPKYSGHGPPFRGKPSPPRGMWTVWGCPFVLSDIPPQHAAIESPFTFQVPFAQMSFHEEGHTGYLDIEDEILEQLRRVLVNLAQRPEMVLLLRTDARAASMPSMRHVRKFLSFIQKERTRVVVFLRSKDSDSGSAIVLVPSSFLGQAVLRLVQLVQRMLPAPYPQAIVSSLEEADRFLNSLVPKRQSSSSSRCDLPTPQRKRRRTQGEVSDDEGDVVILAPRHWHFSSSRAIGSLHVYAAVAQEPHGMQTWHGTTTT